MVTGHEPGRAADEEEVYGRCPGTAEDSTLH